jgi:hypothetical protein
MKVISAFFSPIPDKIQLQLSLPVSFNVCLAAAGMAARHFDRSEA